MIDTNKIENELNKFAAHDPVTDEFYFRNNKIIITPLKEYGNSFLLKLLNLEKNLMQYTIVNNYDTHLIKYLINILYIQIND